MSVSRLMILVCCFRRPVPRAEHGQDASVDVHGHGGGIQGDLLRHHAAGAADRRRRRRGLCYRRYWQTQPRPHFRALEFFLFRVLCNGKAQTLRKPYSHWMLPRPLNFVLYAIVLIP